MLRPNEISEKTFEQVGDGVYSAKEVDAFLNEVSSSYEQVFKQNGELVRRLSLLANRLEAFRRQEELAKKSPEKSINEQFNDQLKAKLDQAKIVAQKMLDDAKKRAIEIVNNANKESDRILIDLNDKIKEQRVSLDLLNSQSEAFKKQLLDAYRQHLIAIDSIPLKAESIVNKMPKDDNEIVKEEKPAYNVSDDNSDIFKDTDEFIEKIDEPVEIEAEAKPEETVSEVSDSVAEVKEELEDVFSGGPVIEEDSVEGYTDDVDEEPDLMAAVPDESFDIDFSELSFEDDDDDEDEEDEEESDEEADDFFEDKEESLTEENETASDDFFSDDIKDEANEDVIEKTAEEDADDFDIGNVDFNDNDEADSDDAEDESDSSPKSENEGVSFKDLVKSKGFVEPEFDVDDDDSNELIVDSDDNEASDEEYASNDFKQDN